MRLGRQEEVQSVIDKKMLDETMCFLNVTL